MRSIPSAIGTDAEDVVWALQTADALWKRQERVDAIVWLRRAAQSAGEAEDDDRALQLAREAAELAEWIANSPLPGSLPAPRTPAPGGPPARDDVDELLSVPPEEDDVEEPTPTVASISPAADRVPTAAEAHAGMLDPWADPEAPTQNRAAEATAVASVAPPPPAFEGDEVVTSAPTMPPKGSPDSPGRSVPNPTLPPPVPTRVSEPQPPATPLAGSNGIDLSQVEALSDLPDDARLQFANAAKVASLARDDEVSGFALALVLEGSVDLSATIVDAAALRLEAGEVLRARGTIESVASIRLIGASKHSRVATWDDQAVTNAFRSCPWVEDELRAAGDRHQALVGITMGPLGERLDPSLRADVASRLRLLTLGEHETIATRGSAVPGLVVVGAGALELLGDDGAPNGAVVRPGEFLFPTEALRAAPAPNTVRAAQGGALVLMADRGVAQELLMTFPPLLEIFAGI